jgi:BNR repeat-like domain
MNPFFYLNRRSIIIRRSLSLLVLIGMIAGVLAIIDHVPAVRAQSQTNLWRDPVNLSSSGSASQPAIATESNGQIHVMWWDKFDGIKYRFQTADGTWSEPVTVSGIFGQRVRGPGGKIDITPPTELTLYTNNNKQVFAFWRATNGDLMMSRTGTAKPAWSGGVRLLTNPLVWQLYVASDNSLNLAYIRGSSLTNSEPGVYFRRSKDGSSWTEPVLVASSLYFRTLSQSNASLSIAADGTGKVLVGWDDPQSEQSYYAQSDDRGTKFEVPQIIESGGIAEIAIPKHVRFISTAGQGFLRLWEASDSCVLYQQALSAEGTWTLPVRALEKVNGCLHSVKTYPANDGRVFATIGSNTTSQNTLSAWDGTRWADPLTPQGNFIEETSNNLVTLGCLTLSLTPEAVELLGCDQKGDIWVLTSQLPPESFLPAAQTAWSQPVILSKGAGDAGLPDISVDPQNRFHAVWSQLPAPGNPGAAITYIRGTGDTWTDAANIINLPNGIVNSVGVLADPNDVLHIVWSGGATGQVEFSQAFTRDALVATDWENPREIPALQPVGDSPHIVQGKSGNLYAVYTIPFNEDRGLYLTVSTDAGQTWSDPVKVFDAGAAGWGVIHQAYLLVDSQEHLHVVWSRAALPNQESPEGIYYSSSTDGGTSWTKPLTVSTDTDSRPKLVAAADDSLHMVWAHATSNGFELMHQWSGDGGQTWSQPNRIPGLGVVAPEVGLAADLTGSVYLVGIELTREASAGVFYLRWNGQTWTDSDTVRLGYDFDSGMGARVALLQTGQLGVFFRVLTPDGAGGSKYEVGYVGRQLKLAADFTPAPTFTPRPLSTTVPVATVVPTVTPISIQVGESASTGGQSPNTVLTQIGIVAAVMILISGVAIVRLWRRIGR